MSHLNDMAHGIAVHYGEASGDTQAAFDPSMILVIIDLVMGVFEMFEDCGKSEDETLNAVHEPSRWERLMLRVHVRRQMGRREFRRRGKDMVTAMLNQGRDMSLEDVQKVYQEI